MLEGLAGNATPAQLTPAQQQNLRQVPLHLSNPSPPPVSLNMGVFSVETLSEFDPPGYPDVDDGLTPEQRLGWSQQISAWMNMEITAIQPDGTPLDGPSDIPRTPLTQFFNGTVTAFETDQKPVSITWIAFPNLVKVQNPHEPKRWIVADSDRNRQDEYLEWSLLRDKSDAKRIITVTYTCEGPEYWLYLAENQPDKVTELYKSLNPLLKNSMKPSDWFRPGGVYFPGNKWNNSTTSGAIAHLFQPNNTLSAEIDIAAQGTVIRKDGNGDIITDKGKLINCSAYGRAERNSDPTVCLHLLFPLPSHVKSALTRIRSETPSTASRGKAPTSPLPTPWRSTSTHSTRLTSSLTLKALAKT